MILVKNNKDFLQRLNFPQGKKRDGGMHKNMKPLTLKPGINQVEEEKWILALDNPMWKKKLNLGYFEVVAAEKKDEKIVITESIISCCYDLDQLEEWLKDGETKNEMKKVIRAQIKKVKSYDKKEEKKEEEKEESFEEELKDFS
jgi:hypothetical protein